MEAQILLALFFKTGIPNSANHDEYLRQQILPTDVCNDGET